MFLTIVCMFAVAVSTTSGAVEGPCTEELARVNARLEAANGMLVGLEKPRCDADGNFAGMQYRGSQAYCVTKDGTSISRYAVNRWETGPNMDCQCARDQYDYQQTRMLGKMFFCEPNGNYSKVQCTGSVCFCADKNGKQVGTSTVNIGQIDSLNC